MSSSGIAETQFPARALAIIALAVLALTGNYFSVPLFFGVDFIFGSVAVVLALQLFGALPAVFVAVIGGLYTLVIWGHPFALVIFTAEALFLGVSHQRGPQKRNLVLVDLAYWLLVGVPLVLIFYGGVMGMGREPAVMIAFKQSINGLFNVLLAGLLIIGAQLTLSGRARWLPPPPRLETLLFHALLSLTLLAGALPIIYESYSQRSELESYMKERLETQARRLADRQTASEPGGPSREQAPQSAQPGQVSWAFMAPDNQPLGNENNLKGLSGNQGRTMTLADGLLIWMPPGDMPTMERWKQAYYQFEMPLDDGSEGTKIVVQSPAEPVVQNMEEQRITLFTLLTAIFLLAILASFLLSRWIGRPLRVLDQISGGLTAQIADGVRPDIPVSHVQEYANLGKTLQSMSATLADSFHELHTARVELSSQVQQRTAELTRTASRLQGVLKAASEFAIVATDRRGEITLFNAGAEKMLGYRADELVGHENPLLFLRSEEIEARSAELSRQYGKSIEGLQALVELPAREGSETLEWHCVTKPGKSVPVSLTVTQQTDENNHVIGYLGVAVDITERQRAEEALKEQVRHTQAIFDKMVDGMITIDTEGLIQSVNPAAVAMFGYTEDEVIGRNVSMLMPSPHREAHDTYLRNHQRGEGSRILGIDRSLEGQRKDGSLLPIELAISEVMQRGQTHYVGMVRDITEHQRVDRMKSEFVSTVSHELRTPLTSISGALGLVVGGALGEMPEQARHMLGIAHNNSKRLSNLINDLLDIEKITAGSLYFDSHVQPVMPVIEHAVESSRVYAADQQVELVLDGVNRDTEVRVDSQRMEQVLANLLSNAVKYSPDGGTVNTSVQLVKGYVRVSVTDHGPGIPEAFRARIFDRFSQADSSDTREQSGTGLGLAITRELVERMGGRINFDSVEGEGTTFWFELPRVKSAEAIQNTRTRRPETSAGARILVVEDDPEVADVLTGMLHREGYQVDKAHTGQQALDALAETDYDAMSLDLMLPDYSGLDIIARVRRQARTKSLPIMVVSARLDEGRLAIEGEFSDIEWLAKPLDEHRLQEAIEALTGASVNTVPRVLHIEDNSDLHQVVLTMLAGRLDFELATSLSDARERLATNHFDAVILDIGLPDGSGWDFLPHLRAVQPEARIIILSGNDMTATEAGKVEGVLLKSQFTPEMLLEALALRIRHQQDAD